MDLIINHLTRMQPGYFCAAGIEPKTLLHVRPVLAGGLISKLLSREGGPFELGAVLNLGPTRFVGATPEIEDRLFEIDQVRVIEPASVEKMQSLCHSVAKNSLHDIFATKLLPIGTSYAIFEHSGLYSLGCCWVERPRLEILSIEENLRLKLHWIESNRPIAVGVADLRFFEADHRTLRMETIDRVQSWLGRTERVLLSVGLTRPYRRTDQDRPLHWLQVNNIHYEIA